MLDTNRKTLQPTPELPSPMLTEYVPGHQTAHQKTLHIKCWHHGTDWDFNDRLLRFNPPIAMGRACSADGLLPPPQKDAVVMGEPQKTEGCAENDVWERDKEGPEESKYCSSGVAHAGSRQGLVERTDQKCFSKLVLFFIFVFIHMRCDFLNIIYIKAYTLLLRVGLCLSLCLSVCDQIVLNQFTFLYC